jgi:hypothetical protein
MKTQKALQSSRFDRGSVKIGYCGWKNQTVPIINMDLTEEELRSILVISNSFDPDLLQRFKDAQNKLFMVKNALEKDSR